MAPFPDFRELRGIAPKATVRCEVCGTEHRGRCHMFRKKPYRKAPPQETRRYKEAAKLHQQVARARWWIKQLTEAVDEARDSGGLGRARKPPPVAQERKRVARRADRGDAAANISDGAKVK